MVVQIHPRGFQRKIGALDVYRVSLWGFLKGILMKTNQLSEKEKVVILVDGILDELIKEYPEISSIHNKEMTPLGISVYDQLLAELYFPSERDLVAFLTYKCHGNTQMATAVGILVANYFQEMLARIRADLADSFN